jgi:gamma-glutamyltranspeptidase/glutathione hydrolase
VPSATSNGGMISTASAVATAAGARILERGGNAVDAAVAAAFCLGVSEPQASGLGGQSMILLHRAGAERGLALDGSSRAPFAIDPMRRPEKPLRVGLQASTVPSTPAALGYLLDRYGSLPLATVLEPAIEAAAEGFPVTALQHRMLAREAALLRLDPLAADRLFADGKPLPAGRTLRQPELAACLRRLAREGWQDFYQGQIGRDIAEEMAHGGGLISPADLSQVPLPVERPVLEGRFRRSRLATFPPPGAGRALVEILNVLETFTPGELDLSRPETLVLLAHVFMAALRDRDRRPVDPALYQQTRRKRMVEKRYAEQVADRVRKLAGFRRPDPPAPAGASGETTHLCAADAAGNVVGITQSIELVFGAKRLCQRHGFVYNNYMSAFEYRDMGHPYFILPGGVPWSSVAPTILYRKGRPTLTLGSPGSERIATALAQVIVRVVDGRADLAPAIEAPRLHTSKAGTIQIELKRFPPQVPRVLEQAGFKITKRGRYSFYLGCVQAIRLPRKPGAAFLGVADPRRDGSAQGPPDVEGEQA